MSPSVSVIGECMLELSSAFRSKDNRGFPTAMSYGGDTLNTAVYLSRAGVHTSYVTALGDDTLSDWMLEEWQEEGIECSQVIRLPNSVPGLYMINLTEGGERSFLYWRENSPASRLFDDTERTSKIFSSLSDASHLYLSGISLGILPEKSLRRLFEHLAIYRRSGGKIVFDSNYRPRLWSSAEVAQEAYLQMYELTDIALPTFDDEACLFDYKAPEQLVESLKSRGVQEAVVKMGAAGCLIATDQVVEHVEARKVTAIDTTAAGDSFNAGFLSARLQGCSPTDACSAGHSLASQVIQHRGAIIPRKSTLQK